MRLALVVLLFLACLVTADNTVKLQCRTVGKMSYIYATGGGFKGLDIKEDYSCEQMGITAPIEIRLVCDKSICVSGCFITFIMGPEINRVCSYSEEGTDVIDFLNELYGIQ